MNFEKNKVFFVFCAILIAFTLLIAATPVAAAQTGSQIGPFHGVYKWIMSFYYNLGGSMTGSYIIPNGDDVGCVVPEFALYFGGDDPTCCQLLGSRRIPLHRPRAPVNQTGL